MKEKNMKNRVPVHRILIAFLLLPITVLVLVPLVLHTYLPGNFTQSMLAGWLIKLFAFLLGLTGLWLLYWTNFLFARFGRGTLAPWNPPEKLIMRGPYRYMRQPMITVVLSVLLGELMFMGSWASFFWLILFPALNMAYIPLVEEKALIKRFGDDYIRYKKAVPGWVPKFHPWNDEGDQ